MSNGYNGSHGANGANGATPMPNPASAVVAGDAIPERIHLRGWALASVLVGLMLTLLLSALDQTIVGTALPRIIGVLHGGDRYTWVVTAYLLASTTVIPIVSKLSDQFGRKWLLMGGVVVFLTGSFLSGAAQTMDQLIYFRGLQGIGGGALMALVFTLIGDIFTPAERAKWQGLFTGIFALASVIGPTAGGYLTDHGPLLTILGNTLVTDDTRWRWVFYVNMPIGILALLALFIWLPSHISLRTTNLRGWAALRRVDFLGGAIAAGATICLLLGLTWGGHQPPNGYPWNSYQVEGLLAGAGVLFILFFVVERFVKEPILPLDLFKNQVFAVGALLALFIGMALFSVAIYLPLYIQGVLGQTATSSGAVITPLTVSMAVGALLVGVVISRLGRYQIISILGAIVLAAGAYLLTQMDANTSLLIVTRNMIVMGVGLGMLQPVMTLAVQNAIPRTRLGVGTGAVTYLRSMGSTLGVAVLGAVASNTFASEFAKRLPAGASQLPSSLLTFDTMEQVLSSPSAKQQIIATASQQASQQVAQQVASQAASSTPQTPPVLPPGFHPTLQQIIDQVVSAASAKVPAGPQHDQIVAQLSQQITLQMNSIITHEVASAALSVPAGPQHDQIIAQLTQQITAQAVQQDLPTVTQHAFVTVFQSVAVNQVTDLLNSIFEAARLALNTAIQHSFYVGLGVCGIVILLTLFLKDIPLQKRAAPSQAPAAGASVEEAPVPVHMG